MALQVGLKGSCRQRPVVPEPAAGQAPQGEEGCRRGWHGADPGVRGHQSAVLDAKSRIADLKVYLMIGNEHHGLC